MKAIHLGSYLAIGFVLLGLTGLALATLHSAENRFAAGLVVGAIYITLQIGNHPDRWRSRTGSLLPALALVAISWLAAGASLAVAMRLR